ncbi:putative armadillo-like helical protein [Helianthus annuus]|nr:putative armadillo-like helical protein [Helianthus annuus]
MRKRSRSKDFDVVGDDPIQMKAFTQRANEKFQHLQKVTSILGDEEIQAVMIRLDVLISEIKEKPVTTIARVSTLNSSKHVLIAEGLLLLHHLLRVLESGPGFAKEKTCARGGISSLLEICEAGTPNSQAIAAGVLRNLASFADTRNNFIEEDAISVLLTLFVLAQDYSIACLSNLVRDYDNLKLLIACKCAIDCLRSFWDSAIRSFEVAVQF